MTRRFSRQLHKCFLLVWYLMYSIFILKGFLMPPHLKQFNAIFIWSLSWLASWILVMYYVQWALWCGLLTTARWMKITVTLSWGLQSDLNHYPWGVWLMIYQCLIFKNEIFSRLPYTLWMYVKWSTYNVIFSHNFINKNVLLWGWNKTTSCIWQLYI